MYIRFFRAELTLDNVGVMEANNHCGYRLAGPQHLVNGSAGPCLRRVGAEAIVAL